MALFAMLAAACGAPGGSSQMPGDAPSPDRDAPPEGHYEGVVRHETSQGVAAVELIVEPQKIGPDGSVSIRLVNRGDVPLVTGYGYDVDHWDGETWVTLPKPEGGGGPDVAIILGPGDSTVSKMDRPEEWPPRFRDEEPLDAGWYRIVKSAQIDGAEDSEKDVELLPVALVKVET